MKYSFILVTPLTSEDGWTDSFFSLMTTLHCLSSFSFFIVSLFQHRSGCINGQNLVHPRNFVNISIGLYSLMACMKNKIFAAILSRTRWLDRAAHCDVYSDLNEEQVMKNLCYTLIITK